MRVAVVNASSIMSLTYFSLLALSSRSKKHAKDIIDEALTTAQHTLRYGVHTTLGSSPGALVFNRDMFLNVPLLADWQVLTEKREHLINETLRQANMKRRWYDHEISQKRDNYTSQQT